MKTLVKTVDIPVLIGCFVNRFEDIKKAFYTGATKVVVPYAKIKDEIVIKEAVDRFGTDNIVVEFDVSPEKMMVYYLQILLWIRCFPMELLKYC